METLKPIFAVLLGLVIGSIINMVLVMLGPMIIPPPGGADIATEEGLKASIHLFTPMNFLFPFLAHALGTLVGALVAALIAPARGIVVALIVAFVFLAGGLMMVFQFPAPLWFSIADLVLAYIPMGFLGAKLAARFKRVA